MKFMKDGVEYIKVTPSKALFRSTMVHEVVTRGDIFAVDPRTNTLTILPGVRSEMSRYQEAPAEEPEEDPMLEGFRLLNVTFRFSYHGHLERNYPELVGSYYDIERDLYKDISDYIEPFRPFTDPAHLEIHSRPPVVGKNSIRIEGALSEKDIENAISDVMPRLLNRPKRANTFDIYAYSFSTGLYTALNKGLGPVATIVAVSELLKNGPICVIPSDESGGMLQVRDPNNLIRSMSNTYPWIFKEYA